MISVKFEGFFGKKHERRPGLRVDSTKVRGFFCKKTGARTIWAVRPVDPMAEKNGRCGHAVWPSCGSRISSKEIGDALSKHINKRAS